MQVDLSSLGILMILFTGWSFIIGLIVEGTKRATTSANGGEAPGVVVRFLPLASMVVGGLSGPGIFPLCVDLAGVVFSEQHASVIRWIGFGCGLGAGAVAGQVVKAYKQTLLGQDTRLSK